MKREVGEDNLTIVAAGIAFYVFLSVFPALFAVVSIYGLMADPAQVEGQIGALSRMMPPGALDLVRQQLQGIVAASPTALGWGAALSVLLALWSATKGTKAMIGGLNIVYDEQERRGFFRVQGLSLLFSLGFVLFLTLSIGLITVVPHLIAALPLPGGGRMAAYVVQWVLLFALVLLVLALLYRYGPSRERPRWRWVSPGGVAGALLWLGASALFSWYAANFGKFNETYGAIAGVVAMLLWLQISCLVVLLGGELNAELEHQPAQDTTDGRALPMGERGAVKADTLPEPHRG